MIIISLMTNIFCLSSGQNTYMLNDSELPSLRKKLQIKTFNFIIRGCVGDLARYYVTSIYNI